MSLGKWLMFFLLISWFWLAHHIKSWFFLLGGTIFTCTSNSRFMDQEELMTWAWIYCNWVGAFSFQYCLKFVWMLQVSCSENIDLMIEIIVKHLHVPLSSTQSVWLQHEQHNWYFLVWIETLPKYDWILCCLPRTIFYSWCNRGEVQHLAWNILSTIHKGTWICSL